MPRAYKSGYSAAAIASRRKGAAARRSAVARYKVVGAGRGYLRTAGYYRGPARSTSELKFLDTSKAETTVANTGTILNTSLCVIPQDGTESGRVGRKVTAKSLMIRGEYTMAAPTDVGATDALCRFIVYHDKQTNGAAAGVTDILETAAYQSFNNLANKGRFRILCDKKMNLQAQGAAASGAGYTFGEQRKGFEKYLKLNLPLEYDNSATTGAITTQRSNNIGVLAISVGGVMQITYTARLRYTD